MGPQRTDPGQRAALPAQPGGEVGLGDADHPALLRESGGWMLL